MKEQLTQNDNILISELIMYAKNLSKENLEHLVWIGEGMCHATKVESDKDNEEQ